ACYLCLRRFGSGAARLRKAGQQRSSSSRSDMPSALRSDRDSGTESLVPGLAQNAKDCCRTEIDRMLKNSQTKVIAPVLTFGLLRSYAETGKTHFSDSEIRKSYDSAVEFLKDFLHHDVHIGAKYYDAYGSRMSRYHVLKPTGHLKYELLPPFTEQAETLAKWIPKRIEQHITERLGVVPL